MNDIKKYRDRAIEVIENSYNDRSKLAKNLKIAFLVANNDLVKFLNLGSKINKKSVIANVNSGVYDDKLKEFYDKNKISQHNNVVEIEKKFKDQKLQQRYEELTKATNSNMPLSFFWLAGSIIEGILCEYCKKNNIKSNKDDIDGYITALESSKKISKGSVIYTTLQHFRQFRNTIHPNNENNDFIDNKNLQKRKEDLDDAIKYFTNDHQSN